LGLEITDGHTRGPERRESRSGPGVSFGLGFERNCVTPVIARFPLPKGETTEH
jgi:hypothetical protein